MCRTGQGYPKKRIVKKKRHTTILRYNYKYGLYGKLWDIIKITSLSAAGEKMTKNSLKETKPEETRTKTRDTPTVFCFFFFTLEDFFRDKIGVH
jgi:hypothetical protein